MKKDIHPPYYDTHIECACGNKFEVGASKENMVVEICSNCHPFYTGKEKLIDAAGRVEKFRARVAAQTKKQAKNPDTGFVKKSKTRKPRGVKK